MQTKSNVFTLHMSGFNLTMLVGSEANSVFFKATDEELSQVHRLFFRSLIHLKSEAYKFVTPVFGPGVVFDSPPQIFYEQIKFIKNGLIASSLKKVLYPLCIVLISH